MDRQLIKMFVSDITAEFEDKKDYFIVKVKIKPKHECKKIVKDYIMALLTELEKLI